MNEAIKQNQDYKEKAKEESAFNSIRDNEEFKKLMK
ncbi:TPR end-of-group domain-containing protein [Rivularia sp. UHCC 0363]